MFVHLETFTGKNNMFLMEQFIYVELKTKGVSSDVSCFLHDEKNLKV